MPGASASTTTASSELANLRDAQQRIIGGFAQEFGVDGDERVLGKALAGGGQLARRGDQFHAGF